MKMTGNPKESKAFVPPPLPVWNEILEGDPNYDEKFRKKCDEIRNHFMWAFKDAFTEYFEPHVVANVDPIRISLSDGPVKPVNKMTCRQIPEDLEKDAEEHIRELLE